MKWDQTRRIIAGFILGILLGAISINTLVAWRVDEVQSKNLKLQETVVEQSREIGLYEQQLKQAQKNLAVKYKVEVQKISIEVKLKDDDFNRITLEEIVTLEMEEIFLGKNVDAIDVKLIPVLFKNKEYEIGDEVYELKPEYVVISKEIQIYLQAIKSK